MWSNDTGDLKSLDELLRRGQANGIALQDLTEAGAKTIEPRVKTYQRALFSPHTSTVNPLHVVDAMEQDALREGIQIHFGTAYMSRQGLRVRTNHDPVEAGYVVNAAGLYTDKIAHPNYRQVSSRSEVSPQFLPLLRRVTQTLTPYVRGGSMPFAGIAQPMTHASNMPFSVHGLNAQL